MCGGGRGGWWSWVVVFTEQIVDAPLLLQRATTPSLAIPTILPCTHSRKYRTHFIF